MIFRRKSAEELPQSEHAQLNAPSEQLIGSIALMGSNEAFIDRVDSLDKTLNKFDHEWTTANNFIANTLSDPDNFDMLEAGIAEYAHHHGDSNSGQRHVRRNRTKVSERDLPDFVKAHVGLARISAFNTMKRQVSEGDSNMDIYRLSRAHSTELSRITGKWATVANTACEHMPTAVRFYTRMNEISKTLSPVFSRAVKYEDKILDDMFSFVSDDTSNSRQLIESLPHLQNSQKREHQVLIKLLATEFSHNNDRSIIGYSLQNLEKLGQGGGLVAEFLDDESGKNGSAEWIEFSRQMFSNLKGQGSFFNYLSSNRASWPSKLTEDYQKFIRDYVSNKQIQLKKDLAVSVDPQLITPTVFQVEQVFDRLIRQVIGAEPKQKAKQSQDDKSRLTSQIMPSATNEIFKKELNPIWLQKVGKNEFQITGGKTLEDNLEKIAQNNPHSQRLKQDLLSIVERLVTEPAGKGTTPLSEVSRIKIGKERYRVMRLNPNQAEGLSVPSANECRVVYSIAGDNLAILGIFTNHSDYESYIKTLK